MGAVYRAFDERLRRTVAIKHILPDIAGDAGYRERLRREAQAAAGLSHPSIVQIFDIFEADGVDWIVMELVEGDSLHSLVESGRLGLSEAVTLTREVSEGLAEAHAKGIVHRDLKTENVMVTRSFHAKILDFGVAKTMGPSAEGPLADPGSILGTGRAMSPEQAMGEEVDPRSDLFSLGTLIYEAVTGRSPFSGSSVYNTLARVCSAPHVPVREVNRQVPAELSNLVDRLLEKNPKHRPQSAREVVVELRVIEKQPLPEWGGPYAPWVGPTEEAPVDIDFIDLDPSLLPPPETPPMASTLGELAVVERRRRRSFPRVAGQLAERRPGPPRDASTEATAPLDAALLPSPTEATAELPAFDPPNAVRSRGPLWRAPSPRAERRLASGTFVKATLALTGAEELSVETARRFERRLRDLALELEGQRLDGVDSIEIVVFERPVLAIAFALTALEWVERRSRTASSPGRPVPRPGSLPGLRAGLHLGELVLAYGDSERPRATGTTLEVARDLAEMARPSQLLVTPEAYRLGLRASREASAPLPEAHWQNLGRYYLDRLEETVDLHVAGSLQDTVSRAPVDTTRVRRVPDVPDRLEVPELPVSVD